MTAPATTAASPGSAQELVPLGERLRWLWLFRALAVLTVTGFAPSVREAWTVSASTVALGTAAYLGLELLMHGLWRLSQQRMLRLFAAVLVVDGLYLAWIAHVVQGEGGPLPHLTLVHLIVVALLASYRTGIKLALWHSTLVAAPLYVGAATTDFGAVAGKVWLFWLVTLATATFSAINERELRRRRYDLEALAQLGTALEATTSPAEVAEALIERLTESFDFPRSLVVAGTSLPHSLLASHGCATGGSTSFPGGEGVLHRTTSGRRTALVAGLDPVADSWLSARLPGAGNLLIVPLPGDDGTLGAVVLEHSLTRGSRVERRVVSMVERFVAHAALTLANAWLIEQIRASAVTDGLTGIANRRELDSWMTRTLARSTRSRQPISLVLVDIDHFKRLNDEFGHQVGDEVLREVAQLIASHARAGDLAARYGGEEFALVLADCDTEQAAAVAERLRAVVESADLPGTVTVTAGVATFPRHAVDAADLIRRADAVLYEGKQGGRNRVVAAATEIGAPTG